MLIAERFVLLALEPTRGIISLPHRGTDAAALCAAGLLLDLVAQSCISVDADHRLHVDTRLPPSHPLLAAASQIVAASERPLAAEAIQQIERRMAPLVRTVLEGLFRRDFLHRLRDWRFWNADSVRFPLRSLQARNDAVATLQNASGKVDDVTGLGLILLADVAGVMTTYLDAQRYERANRALLNLNQVAGDNRSLNAMAAIRDALLA